jgi:Pvc16 N-terminal domain
MSSPLAIAAVTAALKDLLNDGLMNHDLSSVGSFTVTASPPDRITTGTNEPNQLNVFLYQVTSNSGWRNVDLPSRDAKGNVISNAPLALDLHYMLTAYGSQDLNAEILLGYAMEVLHETPVLTRTQLRTVLGATSPVDGTILPSPFGNLSAIDLADQVELIKLSPVFLSSEELSKMWTAMQARYRPTMAYIASVVLIQPSGGARAALPVLNRGKDDTGPVAIASPFPTLAGVRPAVSDALPAMRLGDDLLISGTNLNAQGTMVAVLENVQAGLVQQLNPAPSPTSGAMTVHLPAIAEDANSMNLWASGTYIVRVQVIRPNLPPWTTNGVPVALAPLITVTPTSAMAGDINLTVTCTPRLLPSQQSRTNLIFGAQPVIPKSITTPADTKQPTTLLFTIPAVVAGNYLVRLRVDGIDSMPITITGSPAKLGFDPQQKVKVT